MMLKTILVALTSLFLVSVSSDKSPSRLQQDQSSETGTLEKLIVANGTVAIQVDLQRLERGKATSQRSRLAFTVEPNSFFTILVFNGELRGPERGSMKLIPQDFPVL